MIETQKEQERALLVGVELQQTDNFDMSMEELASLAKTAGALVKGVYTQKREKYDSKTFVGSGKLEEIAQMVEADEIDTVIVNNRLTPRQNVNLEEILGVKVIDRMQLILDILPCEHGATRENCRFTWPSSSTCCHAWLDKVSCSAVRRVVSALVDQVKASWSSTVEAFATRFMTLNANSKR